MISRFPKIALYVAAVLVVFPHAVFVASPFSDGWVPFPLAFDGAVPYRDFYFPTLPGTIWLADLIILLPIPPLFAWHVMSALVVSAVAPSTFALLPKGYSLLVRSTFSLTALVLFLGLTLESIGGWNHLFLSFLWIGTALLIRSLSEESSLNSLTSRFGPELSGVLLTVAVFIKHSAAVSVLFVFLAVIPTQIRRLSPRQKYVVVRSALSAVVFGAVFLGIAAIQQFLLPMLESLGAAGKNPSVSSYLGGIAYTLGGLGQDTLGLVLVLSLVGVSCSKYLPTNYRLASEFLATITFFVSLNSVTAGGPSWLIVVGTVFAWMMFKSWPMRGLFLLLTWLSVVFLTHDGLIVPALASLRLSDRTFLMILALLVVAFIFTKTKPVVGEFVMMGLILGTSLATLVSGDLTMSVLALPAVVLVAHSYRRHREFLSSYFGRLVVVVLVLAVFARLAGTYAQPLRWWGWNEPSLISPKTFSTTRGVEWFWLGRETTQFYESVDELFDEVENASDKRMRIYQAPITPLLVSVSGIEPYKARCVVLWWDLCPEAEAKRTALKLKEDPPEVLVWVQPSDGAVNTHEWSFVRGPSTLRQIERWVTWMVNTGRYREVGETMTVGNSVDTRWPVRVYQLREQDLLERIETVAWGSLM